MRVIVVEPETELSNVLVFVLRREGYEVVTLSHGAEVEQRLGEGPVAAVILDLALPDADGLVVCQHLRSVSDVPIIALSARRHVDELVRALWAGADDFVVKPFHHRELLARLHALLRRAQVPPVASPEMDDTALRLDVERREAIFCRRRVRLSRTEFSLLAYLRERIGQSVPEAELLREVWERDGSANPDLVHVAVRRLRRRLATLEAAGLVVRAIRGGGVVLEGPSGVGPGGVGVTPSTGTVRSRHADRADPHQDEERPAAAAAQTS